MRREKSAFDHINTDWNLPNEDGSTDFSDDDTMEDFDYDDDDGYDNYDGNTRHRLMSEDFAGHMEI